MLFLKNEDSQNERENKRLTKEEDIFKMFEIKRKIFEIYKKRKSLRKRRFSKCSKTEDSSRSHGVLPLGFVFFVYSSSSPRVRCCRNFSGNLRSDFFPHLRSFGTS